MLYHTFHIRKTILPVKDQALNRILSKDRKHSAVHLTDFTAQVNLTDYFLLIQILHQCRICQNKAGKSQAHASADDICDFRVLLRNIIQCIEGQMHRFVIFSDHSCQDFQLRKGAKLYIAAKNLPSVQRQDCPIFFIPFIRHIPCKKFICTCFAKTDIFIHRAKTRYNFHSYIQHGSTSLFT